MPILARFPLNKIPLSRRFIRYLFVGALNTLFGFFAYCVFIFLQFPTWGALLGANVAGVMFNFFTIGGIVFLNLSLSRLPLFVLSYVVIYFINLELLGWLAALAHGRIVAQAILTLPMAILSYLVLGKFVFVGARKPADK